MTKFTRAQVTQGTIVEGLTAILAFAILRLIILKKKSLNSSSNVQNNQSIRILLLFATGHVFRIVWMVWRMLYEYTYFDILLNRITLLELFLGAVLYANQCLQVSAKYNIKRPPLVYVIYALSTLVLLISAIDLVIYYVNYRNEVWNDQFYDFDVLFMSVTWLLVSFGYAIAGRHLIRTLTKSPSYKSQPAIRAVVFNITVSAVVCTVCALLRAVCFAWRPLTDGFLPTPLYLPCFYLIPNCGPTIAICLLLRPKKKRKNTSRALM
eukprot:gnl/Dysnectes_brevis/8855_a16063_282.p1 GENE.gnl/Dysnectes_brevis/8855_a16063_282~~gnl/Dysnectes_brevis/8855_a16063_282.p1  ORF type:complete len:266 (+),score=-2.83 gnl/Dysnectes_brevis/8855_a16063_282:17-814(+)